MGIYCNGLCAVERLVDPDETIGQLKHIVTKGNDDELSVTGPFLLTTQYISYYN